MQKFLGHTVIHCNILTAAVDQSIEIKRRSNEQLVISFEQYKYPSILVVHSETRRALLCIQGNRSYHIGCF